jgi:hypothetical protein
MADTIKVLGQSTPAAATLTDAYTAAAAAVVSSIIAANRSATATSIRVSVAPAGAADATSQYIAYDFPIAGNDIVVLPSFTVASTAKVRVYATLATVTFSIFGVEVS